jgi:uncharacterized protein
VRHLRLADYRRVPWANGRGTTLEMLRIEGPEGLLLRLSMAQVVEDGPFSIFPGIRRSLTVIGGPGFRLEGDIRVDCLPLRPVAFPGDATVRAAGTEAGVSEDFNVMTSSGLPPPLVEVLVGPRLLPGPAPRYILALGRVSVNETVLERYDLAEIDGEVRVAGDSPVIVVTVRSGRTTAPYAEGIR